MDQKTYGRGDQGGEEKKNLKASAKQFQDSSSGRRRKGGKSFERRGREKMERRGWNAVAFCAKNAGESKGNRRERRRGIR